MFFGHFSTRHRRFASRVILFQTRHEKNVCHKHSALKTCLNADTHSQPALPPLLTVNLHPSSRRSFNLHPSHWQLTSPLPNQRSFSTPPAGSQIHPSQSSGHPLPLQLAVKFTPPRPAVILHPCWQPTSPSPPSGHPPPLLAEACRDITRYIQCCGQAPGIFFGGSGSGSS